MNDFEVFYSDYAQRHCVGFNLDQYKAVKLKNFLLVGHSLGRYGFEVLANSETINFEKDFNVIISNSELDNIRDLVAKLYDIVPRL